MLHLQEAAAIALPPRKRHQLSSWVLSLMTLVLCSLAAAPGALAQGAGCQITYTKSWEGGTGYGANSAILNGPAITNGWTLLFTFANGERVRRLPGQQEYRGVLLVDQPGVG